MLGAADLLLPQGLEVADRDRFAGAWLLPSLEPDIDFGPPGGLSHGVHVISAELEQLRIEDHQRDDAPTGHDLYVTALFALQNLALHEILLARRDRNVRYYTLFFELSKVWGASFAA